MNFNELTQEMMANLNYSLEKMIASCIFRSANTLVCGDQIDTDMRHENMGLTDWSDVSFWSLTH